MATEMNEMSTGGAQGIHRRKLQPGVPVIKVITATMWRTKCEISKAQRRGTPIKGVATETLGLR